MTTTTYPCTDASVDQASEEIVAYLVSLGMDKKNILRLRLILEDALIRWKDASAEGQTFTVETGRSLGRPTLTLRSKGPEQDPFAGNADDDFSPVSNRMMAGLGLYPVYTYQKGVNVIQIKLRKKPKSPLFHLLIAAVAAVTVGLLGLLLPGGLRENVTDYVLTPVYDTFLGALNAIAGPMIFLSVAWGIYGIGDAATLGRIGKKILLRFSGITLLITACSVLLLLPFSGLAFAGGGFRMSEFSSIFELLLGIFPKDIVSPFMNGNTTQIILLATVIGSIMLILGNMTQAVAVLIEQINYVITYLMEIVGKLVPFFIFIVLLQLIWSDSYSVIYTAWQPLVYFLAVTLVILSGLILYTSRRTRVSPVRLVRKMFPAFLIALTTASSSASFGSVVNCCEREFGINQKLTSFSVPLGMVLYKPATAVNFVAAVLYFAHVYDVKISLAWMISAIFVISILTIALPPIPGGALACYTIMLAHLTIPQGALELILILDVFFDFLATGFGMVYLQCELLLQAQKMRLIDSAKLKA